MFVESQRYVTKSWSVVLLNKKKYIYSYLKCIVYDKLLKPRQSFLITLYIFVIVNAVVSTEFCADIQNAVCVPGNLVKVDKKKANIFSEDCLPLTAINLNTKAQI
jgi:hypothetical protein